MTFNIHKIYDQIFKIWRKERMNQFLEIIKPKSDELILDVGGTPATWTKQAQLVKRYDCLNIQPLDWSNSSYPSHQIKTLTGDACNLEFQDESYDIIFSNSVIEHVGNWERQKAFVKEVKRVGKRLWIQTPAFECPLEPHFLTPFIHWLPSSIRPFYARWFSVWGWINRPSQEASKEFVANTKLLTKSQFQELFSDCEIITEKLFGVIPKSYIAYRAGSKKVAPKLVNSDSKTVQAQPS